MLDKRRSFEDFRNNPTAEKLERLRKQELLMLTREYDIRTTSGDNKRTLQIKICEHLIQEGRLTRENVADVFFTQILEQHEEETRNLGINVVFEISVTPPDVAGGRGMAAAPGSKGGAAAPVAGDLVGAPSPVAGDRAGAASVADVFFTQILKQLEEETRNLGINVVFEISVTPPDVAGGRGMAAAPGSQGGAAAPVAGDLAGAASTVAGDRAGLASPVAGDLAGAASTVAGDRAGAASPVAGGRAGAASTVAGDRAGEASTVAGGRAGEASPVAGDLAGADSPVAGDQGRAASPVAGGRRKAAANNQTIKQHKEEAKEPGINVVFKVNITAPVAGDQGGAAAPVAGDRGGAAALMAGDRGGAASPVAGDRGGAAATNPAIKQFKEVKEPGINVVFEENKTAPGGRATAAALADSFANLSVSNDDSD
ncbi:circumsporozoite protein-like [Pempheris klunzingeri]|uniref:circumsporozoite protein-like n=1 Tax=Pempheris klunzingeri TaxID=3127111 RepID=UPI00397FF43C